MNAERIIHYVVAAASSKTVKCHCKLKSCSNFQIEVCMRGTGHKSGRQHQASNVEGTKQGQKRK